MSFFRSTIFRHRRGNNNNSGPPDDEGRDAPHENQHHRATGSKELGLPALEEHPEDIKQSINAVQSFLAARLAIKCHSCASNITENFSVRNWIRRWSEGSKGNPAKGCYLCAATCPSCRALTCLGCGNKVCNSKNPHEIEGYYMDWCCDNGRLFGIWLLLARYDRVEIRWQASSSVTQNKQPPARNSHGPSQRKTQDARGIGYADGSMGRYSPFTDFFHDGSGFQPLYSNRPLRFHGSDEKEDEFVAKVFDFVGQMIPGSMSKNLPSELHAMLQLGLLLDKVADLLRNDSLDDVTKRSDVYKAAFGLVSKLSSHPELIDLAKCARYHKQQTPGLEILSSSKPQQYDSPPLILGEKIASVGERLKQLARQSKVVLDSAESQDLNTRSGEDLLLCCESILSLYSVISAGQEGTRMRTRASPQEKWEAFHQEHGVSRDEGVFDRTHAYYSKAITMTYSSPGRIKRMVTEVANMSTSLPIGIFVKVSESRPDVMKCLIMGPPDSPYGYALFETAIGKTINPNLHPDGKVCLSLLGTWRDGDAAAQWQPGKSTILSVLISIQAMIFTEDPWRNEPAYTSAVGTMADIRARRYIEKIQPQIVTAGMLNWLTQPRHRYGIWQKVIRAHFKYNKANILAKVDKWANENPVLKFRGIVQELKLAIEDINRR
ncbi:uncharacterized protein ARB_01653 [Trichophyton benhamiae CBS 112371]|uniref:Uncharacterized protein n=1 Tax=Arthroderma benhamiae (strain ATCC MYA-4681 / CBS 112371) TaxID=663331 RepID=D4AZN5_ARTBC|nr:uncharacterized protein ARB_01653 [Trichophyton benhamiae CBS 112371]EFE31505.1 hypothetical protein ARB_01653 [Trichophyton benhamiae CBS 112371]